MRAIEIGLGSAGVYADRLWREAKERRMQAGEVLGGTPAETELLRLIDAERIVAVADDHDTADARRRRHRDHWARGLGGSQQVYQPHPARAGP